MNQTADLVLDCKNALGESCFLDPRDDCLWWTDIEGSRIWRMLPDGSTRSYVLPGRAGFIMPRVADGFVVGFPNQICLTDGDLQTFTRVHDVEPELAQTRINDACVDPYGGIVFGTFDETRNMDMRGPVASVYRLGPDGSLKRLFGDVVVSNGLAFSPDGSVMYFADTAEGTIRRFSVGPDFSSFEETAPLAGNDAAPGMPDGAKVDAEGNYWNARVWGGCVVRFDSNGNVTAKFELPTKGPTCVAFGGAGLTQVFITTLRVRHSEEELAASPHAGGLYSVASATPGLPQALCAL